MQTTVTGQLDEPITPQLDVVQETMLITAWARAVESQRHDAIVRDPHAERLVDAIDYDFGRFRGAWKSQVGVAVRTRLLDDLTRRFLDETPDAVVVNVGAGLDTRFSRVDNGAARWIDLDMPDAIDFRRTLLSEERRNTFVAGSVLDGAWIERVRALDARRVLIIAEGVLMFLPRVRVQRLVHELADLFPGGEMIFDVIGGLMVRCPWLHDTLPATRARFEWGVGRSEELAAWSDRIELLQFAPMLHERPDRWRWMRWLRHVPYMRDQFAVAHLRFV